MDSKIEPVAWLHKPTGGIVDPLAKGLLVKRFSEELQRDVSVDFEDLVPAAALLAAEQRGRESERERCAKIADDGAEQADRAFRGFTALNAAAFMHGRAQAVAAAIRKGE